MDNEMKAKRLEDMARWDEKQALRWKDIANNCKSHPNESAGSMALSESASSDAALLREAAQFMREREGKSLLTERDWKGMYEAQERDMAALRQELEGLKAGREEAMSLLGKLMEAMAALRQELEGLRKEREEAMSLLGKLIDEARGEK